MTPRVEIITHNAGKIGATFTVIIDGNESSKFSVRGMKELRTIIDTALHYGTKRG